MKKHREILLIGFLVVTYFLYNKFFKLDIVKYNYDKNYNVIELNDGLLKVSLKDKCGVLTNTGEVLLPLEFDDLNFDQTKRVIARKKGKYGVMTLKNKVYLDFIYDNIESVNSKYYKVKKGDIILLIDKRNKKEIVFEKVLDIKYINKKYFIIKKDFIEEFDVNLNKKEVYLGDNIYPINDKVFLLEDKNDYYLISGKKKFKYSENIEQIYDEYLIINEGNKRSIRKIGEEQPLITGYDAIYMNEKDSIIIQKDGKYGIIDMNNKIQILYQYDKISPFYKGYYAVELNFKCGLIDKNGKIVLPLEYEAITNFNQYFALVYTNKGLETVFLKEKKVLSNLDEANFLGDDKILVKKENSIEIYNNIGQKILALKLDEIKEIKEEYIVTKTSIIEF